MLRCSTPFLIIKCSIPNDDFKRGQTRIYAEKSLIEDIKKNLSKYPKFRISKRFFRYLTFDHLRFKLPQNSCNKSLKTSKWYCNMDNVLT
ncbi:CLUMA_CG006427, isoform A [Clunio marinus]|uniref:CLUMA_CG006427, isoform A n=1 Tax=Clunio marinus TaxID=568069 RepID=A0A1J1HY31_9DIPT|nr:CLUMA_CG006427, isoform A [Clunio marinus]